MKLKNLNLARRLITAAVTLVLVVGGSVAGASAASAAPSTAPAMSVTAEDFEMTLSGPKPPKITILGNNVSVADPDGRLDSVQIKKGGKTLVLVTYIFASTWQGPLDSSATTIIAIDAAGNDTVLSLSGGGGPKGNGKR